MSHRPIMDAGPGINFFAANHERLLFSALGPLSVPEAVETVILRKARQDQRFAAAERVWKKLPRQLMEVLSDDVNDELSAAVQRISGLPLDHRIRSSRDLGETMVVGHAAVAAQAGADVIVLIDDGDGRRAATTEARRLQRLKSRGEPVGSIRLINTVTVLERAAGGVYLPDRQAMRKIYLRLRSLDNGLLPLEDTKLMGLQCWG